jgi:hypothetical protein
MQKIIRSLLFLTLILSACSPGGLSRDALPPTLAADAPTEMISSASTGESQTTEVLPPPKLIATVSTPHIDQGPAGANTVAPSNPQDCAYQWAYKGIPELSSGFQLAIHGLQPEAQATAFAFGEDCIHNDGSATFIPMETDFNVTLQVSDLSDEAVLGEWIVKIMQVVTMIPPDQIIGARPGRVSVIFESNGQRTGVNFYIDQYQALPSGLTDSEIYQALQTSQ